MDWTCIRLQRQRWKFRKSINIPEEAKRLYFLHSPNTVYWMLMYLITRFVWLWRDSDLLLGSGLCRCLMFCKRPLVAVNYTSSCSNILVRKQTAVSFQYFKRNKLVLCLKKFLSNCTDFFSSNYHVVHSEEHEIADYRRTRFQRLWMTSDDSPAPYVLKNNFKKWNE